MIDETDIPLLHEWLNLPHVAEWWGGPLSFAEVQRKYVPRIQDSTVKCYIASVRNRPLGFIQTYRAVDVGGGWWPDEHDHGVYGIDQYIADPNDLGRGLGRQMVGAFVEFLFSSDPHVTRIQADPTPHNVRAIRCYKAVGFEERGIVDTPDGKAMLMVIERGTGSTNERDVPGDIASD